MRALAVAAAAVLALASCGAGQDPSIEVPSTARPGITLPTTTAPPLVGGSMTSVSTPASERTLLSALRVAAQPDADRVVFEFDGVLPGYTVRYIEPPVTQDGSGQTVEVNGEAFLEVRMESASAVDISGDQVKEVYTGPDRVSGDTTNVTEVVETGDFEGVLTWVIGVERKDDFRVSSQSEPNRLVIEIAR